MDIHEPRVRCNTYQMRTGDRSGLSNKQNDYRDDLDSLRRRFLLGLAVKLFGDFESDF